MEYGAFILSQLLKVSSIGYSELEYDIMFETAISLHNIFIESKYNNENISEYDGINQFLFESEDAIRLQIDLSLQYGFESYNHLTGDDLKTFIDEIYPRYIESQFFKEGESVEAFMETYNYFEPSVK